MANKLPLFICFIITFIFSCSSETTIFGTISWWCSQTPHHQTCDHYLNHLNFSNAIPISTIEFLEKTVHAAKDEALVVRQLAHETGSKYPNALGKSLWSSCVDYFDEIVFTLNMIFDRTLDPTPLDIQTWLSASLAYINVCEKGFELINMTNTILPIISNNLTQLITNSLAISVVNGGSNDPGFVDWNIRNENNFLSDNLVSPNVVVAQDGSGDFTTVQDAVNAVSSKRTIPTSRFVIYVKVGVYTENVVIPNEVQYITMYGDGIDKTIITGNRHLGGSQDGAWVGDLKATSTFQVWGSGFMARDMTFQNTYGPQGHQAVALLSASDQSVFYHCSFEGYQDTLFAIANKQFYKECQIFGTVDFIFGDALAVFQDCGIFFRKPLPGGGLVVTAHGRTNLNESTGFSLQGCKITAGDDLKPVISQYAFLGRPWQPYALTVYMENYLDDLVDPQGWEDMSSNSKTCYYGEFYNYGPGSSTANRVKWPTVHIITNWRIAAKFTVARFLLGNLWLPKTGVPYIPAFEKKYNKLMN